LQEKTPNVDSLRNSVASFGIEPHPVNADHVLRLSIGVISPLTTLILTAKVASHASKMLRFCVGLATHQRERKPDKNFLESNVSRLRESHLGTAELQWPALLEQEENTLAGCSKCRLAREATISKPVKTQRSAFFRSPEFGKFHVGSMAFRKF
jgi:hypothetical protein